VTLKGDNLNDLGTEPRSQAHIFGLSGNSYSVQLTGAAAPVATDAAGDDGAPKIEQIMPRILGQTKLIIALALGILALGFVLLYRAPGAAGVPRQETAKESRERARR
jgi:hypothetical protein